MQKRGKDMADKIRPGIIGAIIARFRPHGTARALFATALAQALVAMIAWEQYFEALILNGFFIALWVGSGRLCCSDARRASTTKNYRFVSGSQPPPFYMYLYNHARTNLYVLPRERRRRQ